MKFLKPIRWKEGLFLRPQHLQQFDLYLESREISRLEAHESHGWGLLRLELGEESLNNFVLGIHRLQAVLPDGTFLDVPGNATVSDRPFEEAMLQPGQPLQVSIGVRALDEQQAQVATSAEDDAQARFVASDTEVYDLDMGRDPATVELLSYNLRFFLGEEPTHGFVALPIMQLVRTGDRANPVRLDPKFSPPTLLLKGSRILHEMTRSVYERLALTLREHGQKRGSSDPDPLILYQALAGCLPVLKDMAKDGEVHPHLAYVEMARLAGALFYRDREGRSPDIIPPYDHRTPAPVFERLQELIFDLCHIVIQRNYQRVPLERAEDRYTSTLPDDVKKPGTRFYLEVEAGESMPRVRGLLLAAKISNPSRISTLRDYALPGVPTEPVTDAPNELGPGQTGTFFRLKHEHEEWSTQVVASGEIEVNLLGAPSDVNINLILVFAG